MADSYEVTMMYRVHTPDGTEQALGKAFNTNDDDSRPADEVLTELISEVISHYQNTIATFGGKDKSDWVYLRPSPDTNHEMWSEGWYLVAEPPPGWEGSSVALLRRIMAMAATNGGNTSVRAVVENVESTFMSWIWEGEDAP
jgi:hypothetical protein